MKDSEYSVAIRRMCIDDAAEMKDLCKRVRREASNDEIIIHLQKLMLHPYLYLLIFSSVCVIYDLSKLSFLASILICLSFVSLLEGLRFYFFWRKIRDAFEEGPYFRKPLSYCCYPKRFFLVAKMNDHVIGMVGISGTDKPEVATLFRMFVDSDYRKRGIGRMLLEKCYEFCKENGYTLVMLHTHSTSKHAMRFYEKAGYSFMGQECSAFVYPHHFDNTLYAKNMQNKAVPAWNVSRYTK